MSTIESDKSELVEIEEVFFIFCTQQKLLKVIDIATQVTKEMSIAELPAESRIELTKRLTKEYLMTVDVSFGRSYHRQEICDTLRKLVGVMDNYRESYRVGSIPYLDKMIDILESGIPESRVHLDPPQRKM